MSQATPPPPPPVQADAAYNVAYLGASGVRFAPEDWELIAGYLRRKIHGEPLPAAVVHDGDVYAVHPKKLVSEMGRSFDGSWYVFSPRRRKYPHGSRPSRLTDDGTGHWKSMSAKEAVHGADGKVVIGYKCGLTFHEHVGGDGSVEESKKEGKKKTTEREHGGGGGNVEESKKKGKKKTTTTVWKMQELVVAGSDRHPDNAAPDKPMQLNEWVLCKITNKSLLETEEGAAPVVQGPEAEQLQQRATSSGGDESPDDQHLQASAEAPNGPDVAAAAAATTSILQEPWPDDDGFFYDGASFLDENYADLAWWEELLAGGDYMGMADGGGESSGSQDKHPLEQQQQQREEEATASGVVAGSQDEQQQAASGGVSGKQDEQQQQQQQQQAAPQAPNGGYVNVAAAASPETGLVLGDHDWKRHLGVLIP